MMQLHVGHGRCIYAASLTEQRACDGASKETSGPEDRAEAPD